MYLNTNLRRFIEKIMKVNMIQYKIYNQALNDTIQMVMEYSNRS